MKAACISYVLTFTQTCEGKMPSKRANLKLKVGKQEVTQAGDKANV
jgi:hypothetical protein